LIVEISAEALVQRMLARLKGDAARIELEPADWLVVDDLHVLSGKPVTQAEVGRLLRTVVDRGGRVACASGGPASRIQVLADAVQHPATHKVIEVGLPRPREMRRIIARQTAAIGLSPTDATLAVLADQARGDVRRAIGALTRLRFEQTLSIQ
jgi:chromosomal replication initiation ATPase DnaA